MSAAGGGWLSLAATPSFALMALLTATHAGPADMLCSAAMGLTPLGGMVPMYLLMSLFHCQPWVALISRRVKANELRRFSSAAGFARR